MKARRFASSWRVLVPVCLVLLVCSPEVVRGQVGRRLASIPVVIGADHTGPRGATSDQRHSQFDRLWPVIRLRQTGEDRYEGRAELRVDPNTAEPLGCRITAAGVTEGSYSCNVSSVRSLRSGETVTVSAVLKGSGLDPAEEGWEEMEVATVFIDGGTWEAAVPVVMDGTPAAGDSAVTIKQIEVDHYEGCAEIRVGANATLPLSCRITGMGLFSGEYACSITTPEDLAAGETVTVCAMLKEPGCSSQLPGDASMAVAMLSIEGGAWQTEIPVTVDAKDWSSIVTGTGSQVFVPEREALRLGLRRTTEDSFEACLDFKVKTDTDMNLEFKVSPTGVFKGQYSCSFINPDVEAPGGTATVCAKMRPRDWRGRLWDADDRIGIPRWRSWLAPGTRVATVFVYGMPAESDVNVAFVPRTLSLTDEAGSVTCHLELPKGYAVGDVDVLTVMLNDRIPAQLGEQEIGDYDENGCPDLAIAFGRRALVERLRCGPAESRDEVELVVTGELTDGTPFRGRDMVRIVGPTGGE